MPRPKPRSKSQSKRPVPVAHAERRVITDLKSWNIDPEQIDEVRAAFDAGNRGRAMGLARDLGWKPNLPPRKTPAQLDRDIAEALSKRPLIDTRRTFWNVFEDVAARDVGDHQVQSYSVNRGALDSPAHVEVTRHADEPAEVFAHRIREAVERFVRAHGFKELNYNSRIFEKFGRRLGFKVHTRANLKTAYEQMS